MTRVNSFTYGEESQEMLLGYKSVTAFYLLFETPLSVHLMAHNELFRETEQSEKLCPHSRMSREIWDKWQP